MTAVSNFKYLDRLQISVMQTIMMAVSVCMAVSSNWKEHIKKRHDSKSKEKTFFMRGSSEQLA